MRALALASRLGLAPLAAPAAATPASDVARAFERIHALLASQKGLDARSIAALDKKARAEGAALEKHGWRGGWSPAHPEK